MSEEKKKKLMPELLPAPTKAEGRSPAEAAAGQGAEAKTRARADHAAAQGSLLGFVHIGACRSGQQKGGQKSKNNDTRFHIHPPKKTYGRNRAPSASDY